MQAFESSLSRRQLLAAASGIFWLHTAAVARPASGLPGPRVITVGGAITEVVYALEAQKHLVGTDTTSLYPPAAQATTKVGYLRQLSAEGLLALRPDALIAPSDAGPPVVLDQLRSAGVRVELVHASHDWDEVQRKVQAVGRALDRMPQAKAFQDRLDAQWNGVQTRVAAARGRAPRVLFVLAHSGSPTVAGSQTAADAVIRLAGAHNAMAGFNGYRPLAAEAVAAAAPDVILTTQQSLEAIGGTDSFWKRPEWPLTPAGRRPQQQALLALDALELLGFGPRLPATVDGLHRRLSQA